MRDIDSVMIENTDSLMKLPGVVGVYRGELEDRTPCIKVMVVKKTKELEARIPKKLDGYPVVTEETGEIRPLEQ